MSQEESEARMVRVEASGLPPGFDRMVMGQGVSMEENLRFVDLYAALGEPQAEEFWLLQASAFILEVEVDEQATATTLRKDVEAALNELGADWGTAEFDEEDTMSEPRRKRKTMGGWD